MNMIDSSIAAAALAIAAPAFAQQAEEHRLGAHPAIVVQRLAAQQGYDYESKFYPHPAWLYLLAEEPHRMNDHPAVTVFKHEQERREALAAEMAPRRLAQDSAKP